MASAAGLLVAALVWAAVPRGTFMELWGAWERLRDMDELARAIRSYGNWGVALSIGLMVVHSFVPFPAEVIAIANGVIYGPLYGTLITWIGAMLGAQAAFWTARSFGRTIVERRLRPESRLRAERWITENGTAALLTMRLIPVIAFNLINYVAGLAGVRWWTFTWTTAIGIVPLTFLMVIAGDQMKTFSVHMLGLFILGGLLLWFLVRWLRSKRLGRGD